MRRAAVLFDLAGTLTSGNAPDEREPWLRYAEVVAPDHPDELADALLEAERRAGRRCDRHGSSARFGELLDEAGSVWDEAAVGAFRRVWAPYTTIDPSAADALRRLHDLGASIGLLSNTIWPREWHVDQLCEGGVLDLFDALTFSSDLPVAKPHPDAFRLAADALGVDVGDCLFVGDRWGDDVCGSAAAGLSPVWIRNAREHAGDVGRTPVVEPRIIDSCREIVQLL